MKLPDSITQTVLPLLALTVVGLFAVDTFYRLFVKRPDSGAAENTVSLALGKARPWSAVEQEVLTRLLPPCRDPAAAGKLTELVDCLHQEAQRSPAPATKGAPTDDAVLTGMLDRAGYQRQ